VARFTGYFKQAFLRVAWASASDQQPPVGTPLHDFLMDVMSGRVTEVTPGRFIAATSQGGTSVSFDFRGITPMEMADLCAELLTMYEQGVTNGLAITPNESVVYAYMLDQLRPVKGYTGNFMYLAK
jgi:hypothetical protein